MERNMDNDDKVNNNEEQLPEKIQDSKAIFLKDDAVRYAGAETYDLEKEFAKTKKNRSPFVWITIMLFVAVFTAAAVLITVYIQNRSKNVPVDIEDFADVNLKDVLDKAKQYETQLDKARRELQDLRDEMNRKIEEVRQTAARDIELIETRNLSQGEENRQTAEVRSREEEQIASIRSEYEELIREKEEEIAGIQEKLNQYDTQMVEQARAQEEILNNQQKKFELEMEQTVNYYEDKIEELTTEQEENIAALKQHQEEFTEQLKQNQRQEINRLKREQAEEIRRLILKYNPIFTGDELKTILTLAVDDIPQPKLATYKDILAQEGIISRGNFDLIHTNIYRINTLLERIDEIPYINSMPDAVGRIRYFGAVTYNDYEQLVTDLIRTVENKNNVIYNQYLQLGRYQYALSTLIDESREHGYILDPRNPDSIHIFLDEMHAVKTGDVAYVFRRDDELIAKIEFTQRQGHITASLLEQVSEEKAIEPFDKILIQSE